MKSVRDDAFFGERYQLQELLGEGGMGTVYRAYDTAGSRTVAIKKMIAHHLDSPESLLGFKNEFRMMSQFQHPNTVRVYDYGMGAHSIPFIVMEYVEGRILSDLRDVSIPDLTGFVVQLCQALSYIHSRNCVHRDLKPSNIKVLDNGSLKLLDYGLMCQPGTPVFGRVSGTIHYLAPETIAGGIIDESTDLYSIGVLAYELIARRLPFTGSREEILKGHLRTVPVEPRSIRKDVPASLNDIIMKLLKKDKEHRYRSASAVLDDLRHLCDRHEPADDVRDTRAYLYSSRLIGRELELERAGNLIKQAASGNGGSLFAGAPAGMGKTRFLQTIKTLVQLEGFQSIWLGSSGSSDRIYGWVRDMVRNLVASSSLDDIEKYGPALSAVSPEIAQRLNMPTEKPQDEEIVSSLSAWLTALGHNAPLAIFSDDLHWMDPKSVSILNEMIRRAGKSGLLLISAFRNDEVEKASPIWQTTEEGRSDYIELYPLKSEQTRALLDNILFPTRISDEFAEFTYGVCGGNVFDLIEFLQYLVDEGYLTRSGNTWSEPVYTPLSVPPRQEQRVISRLNKLNEDAKNAAAGASVIGEFLSLENWSAVSAMEESRFFDAIQSLVRHQVMNRIDGKYQFSHYRIKEAVYENIPENERRELHLKAAHFLKSEAANEARDRIPIVARHFAAAGSSREAVDYSLQAAHLAEQDQAEWLAFDHYRAAARFLERDQSYPEREKLLIEIYEKAARFNIAAWIDAATCFEWLDRAIAYHGKDGNTEKVFGLSLSHIVSGAITSNYALARRRIEEIIDSCGIREGTIQWAVLYGAGVCLVDWYEGYQNDCFDHAVKAVEIFEQGLDTLADDLWPAYAWSLFWRDKARAYLGKAIVMENIEKIRGLTEAGKSDLAIYWHTLTAVGARAAFSGRYRDLIAWKDLASRLSRKMGRIYWLECWISHSYLYAALDRGDFSQIEQHIERVAASPDPYQVRLSHLFRGRWELARGNHEQALHSFAVFLDLEERSRDNSYLEGVYYVARTYLETEAVEKAEEQIEIGAACAEKGPLQNPMYQLQFARLRSELALAGGDAVAAERHLAVARVLAAELDNPIQTAYIDKSFGLVYQFGNKPDQAKESFRKARDIFLAIENKYQAGRVTRLLDQVSGRDLPDSSPNEAAASGACEINVTELDNVDSITIFDAEIDPQAEEPGVTASKITEFDE